MQQTQVTAAIPHGMRTLNCATHTIPRPCVVLCSVLLPCTSNPMTTFDHATRQRPRPPMPLHAGTGHCNARYSIGLAIEWIDQYGVPLPQRSRHDITA